MTTATEHPGRERPPLALRLLGQGLSLAIARAPGTWRMLRRPTQRFWERAAAGWDERIQPDRPEHLAPLAAACEHLGSEPTFAVGDAASLPYPDGAFDLVTQLNLPAYLAEAARVLAPGGHLVVASSLGAATPYHTPEGLLRKGCAEHGLEPLATGEAGEGTYLVARRLGETTA